MAELALIFGAYFLGVLPIVYVIGRLRGVDLRGEDDLHFGLWHRVGRPEGTIGIMADMAKGVIPVLAANNLGFGAVVASLAGLAAVSGQMWPIFFRFSGERGNSTGLAMAGTLVPRCLPIVLIPVVIGAAVRTIPRMLDFTQSISERLRFGGSPSKSLPLGMIIGFAILPVSAWWLYQNLELTLACLTLLVLIVMRRLTVGLRTDLRQAVSRRSILINRLLFDRSYD